MIIKSNVVHEKWSVACSGAFASNTGAASVHVIATPGYSCFDEAGIASRTLRRRRAMRLSRASWSTPQRMSRCWLTAALGYALWTQD